MKTLSWLLAFTAWYAVYIIWPEDVAILTATAATIYLVRKTPEWFAPEEKDDIDVLLEEDL